MNTFREIPVFIASPGDLAPERRVFKETIDALNSGFGQGAGVQFVALGWEDLLAVTGRRTQGVINIEVDRCELFFLVLHRRWGQPSPDSRHSSYTEEEFQRALKRWKKTQKPEVLVFFKTVDNASIADPGPELLKVLAFRKKLEKSRSTLFRTFNTEIDFGREVDRHLRAYVQGKFEQIDEAIPDIAFSKAEISALEKTKQGVGRRVRRAETQLPAGGRPRGKKKAADAGMDVDLSLVKQYQTTLALARAAVEAAQKGRSNDATILFAQATEGTTDLSVLALAVAYFRQIGDIENASRLVRRQAAIARDRTIAARHYMALLPKGWMDTFFDQMITVMLAQYPEDMADEIRSVCQEAFGEGRLETFLLDLMVKHYSTEELVLLSQFMGKPEGQSALQKQAAIMEESMQFGASEFQRIYAKRHPPDEP